MSSAADLAPGADYAVYGLGGTWADVRWLESRSGEVGAPPWTVWLGHGARRDPARVIVGSAPRARFDALHAGLPAGHPSHVAFEVGLHMIGYTLPDPAVPRPDGLVRRIGNEMHRQAIACEDWPEIGWTVDGREVPARVWKFAGSWAAFTDGVRDSYVLAIGTGVEPGGLDFAEVLDGAPYGVDLESPLWPEELPPRPLPVVRPERLHPEQLRLPDGPAPSGYPD